jgi:phosphate acetyltransferase
VIAITMKEQGVDCVRGFTAFTGTQPVIWPAGSTIHAAALCKMAERGQITGGVLDGPLAFDTAVSPEAIKIKQLVSSVAGQADIVVVPDLESGNMLAKQLEYLEGARLAGIITGASVPIILTSRADSSKTRMTSAAIASLTHVSETKLCF